MTSSTKILVLLGALTAFAPLSIDMYLPSLPRLGEVFGASAGRVQLTLGAFFVGLSIGQLVYGPLADRFGRRRPLLAGIALYVVGSAMCALATSIDVLIVARFVQALGGCAGIVVARAVVRDLFDQQEAARAYSILLLVMGLAPILAPLGGGYLLLWFDWLAIFWFLALFGAVLLAWSALGLPETLPVDRRRIGGMGPVSRGYLELLARRRFVGYALAGGVSQAGMFAYISGSPVVLITLYGIPEQAYGWIFGANAAGLIGAAQLNRRLLRDVSSDMVLYRANAVTALLGVWLIVTAATGLGGLAGLLVGLFGYVGSLGFTQPNAMAGAMSLFPDRAGSAAAVVGSVQFAMGAVAGALVGLLYAGTPLAMAAVIAGCGIVGLIAQRTMVGRPQSPPE